MFILNRADKEQIGMYLHRCAATRISCTLNQTTDHPMILCYLKTEEMDEDEAAFLVSVPKPMDLRSLPLAETNYNTIREACNILPDIDFMLQYQKIEKSLSHYQIPHYPEDITNQIKSDSTWVSGTTSLEPLELIEELGKFIANWREENA